MKNQPIYFLIASALLAVIQPAIAGPNDFFGSSIPGSVPSASNPPLAGGSGSGDYSDDEKRMQRKYRGNMQHARDLINKGAAMMKKGEAKHNDKEYKRGKILKEIGEKQLADLQANNPFPDPRLEGKTN